MYQQNQQAQNQQAQNLMHIQLNGNNQLGIGALQTINVKPIKLQSRAQSLNPNLRISERNKQTTQISSNRQTISNKSPSNLQTSKSGGLQTQNANQKLSSSSAPKKISGNFSSRVIYRAKTKNEEEIIKKQSSQTSISTNGDKKGEIIRFATESQINNENSTPNSKIQLPPIQEKNSYKFYINSQSSNNQISQDQSPPQQGMQVFNLSKNKENQFAKKRHFDFLERTKVKNQSEETDLLKMHRYFRCKVSNLITGSGKKQYYLQYLKDMKDLMTKVKQYERVAKQNLFINDVMNKLKKIVATRAKYKYKEKIDFTRSIIMRTLGYESRQIIQQLKENMALEEQGYEDLEDDADREYEELKKKQEQQALDKNQKKELISSEIIANWKKMRGYQPNQKVFICIGQYTDLKNYLKEQGWIENPNPESLVFDLKWVTKKKDVDKDVLLDQQITNHFQKNHNLTSKNGIALNLRNLIWYDSVDIDTFYPRCFDLSDVQEFEDFIEEFKFTQAESTLKLYVENKLVIDQKAKQYEKYLRLKILLACVAIKRRTYSIEKKISLISVNTLPIISPEEWSVINRQDNNYLFLEQNPDVYHRLSQIITREMDSEESNAVDLSKLAQKYLEASKEYDPQYDLNQKNLWIVKPAGLSRGRGIRAFDQLEPLLNYIMGKDVMWVAQKYMENPLTINKKKFDIRQWVLVTEWNPLTIYFYDTCYIRVCFDEYDPSDLQNKFAHLANNCISKHAENFEEKVNDTMMYLEDFVEYIRKVEGKDMFYSKIQKEMMNIAINSIKSCKDSIEPRRNSLELYGYDFMVDENYNTWLLEINSSPSMEYSTPVTTKLVKMGLEDTAKVIHHHFVEGEKRFNKNTEYGLWKNIYREQK
ncbi:hypothetical protein ABPG74_015521 [Tetrahymena malaccensis]